MKIFDMLTRNDALPNIHNNFQMFINNERQIIINMRNMLRDIAANLNNQKKNL